MQFFINMISSRAIRPAMSCSNSAIKFSDDFSLLPMFHPDIQLMLEGMESAALTLMLYLALTPAFRGERELN